MSKTDEHSILEVLERVSQAEAVPEATTRAIERARQALQAVSGTTSAESKRRFTRLRMAKWLLPAAAAAAVLVAVGLWPASKSRHAPGQVYALSEVPELTNKARILHARSVVYVPVWAPSEQERYIWMREYWVDQVAQRWCKRTTYLGKRAGHPSSNPQMQYGGGDGICDGQYVMYVDHRQKTVTYEKPAPFRLRWNTRQAARGATPFTVEELSGYTYSGQEMVEGELQQIWEGREQPCGDEEWNKRKLWFSPQKGEVGRIELWGRLQAPCHVGTGRFLPDPAVTRLPL